MISKIKKGNYYRNRTKKFFEEQGYCVTNAEISMPAWVGGRVIHVKKDLWGADLICMTNDEMIFIQVKSNAGDITRGLKEFEKYPFPDFIKRWVVYWPLRAREPEIHKLEI